MEFRFESQRLRVWVCASGSSLMVISLGFRVEGFEVRDIWTVSFMIQDFRFRVSDLGCKVYDS